MTPKGPALMTLKKRGRREKRFPKHLSSERRAVSFTERSFSCRAGDFPDHISCSFPWSPHYHHLPSSCQCDWALCDVQLTSRNTERCEDVNATSPSRSHNDLFMRDFVPSTHALKTWDIECSLSPKAKQCWHWSQHTFLASPVPEKKPRTASRLTRPAHARPPPAEGHLK